MAILPDLDPTQIGVIAFWNAHDHRADPTSGAVIDPTDVLGVLKSYTLYDNGVDGAIDYGPRTGINVRVKNDGWIIAWIDRDNTYQLNVSSYTAEGYYDLLYNWKDAHSAITADTNTLVEVISYLYNQLTNKSAFTFLKSDVGVFCYEFFDTSTITMASSQVSASTDYLKYIITSGTKVNYFVATGATDALSGGNAYVRLSDGTNIASGSGKRWGAIDMLGNFQYDYEDVITMYGTYTYTGWATACIILMWL